MATLLVTGVVLFDITCVVTFSYETIRPIRKLGWGIATPLDTE